MRIRLLLTGISIIATSCTSDAGKFSVRFDWRDAPPDPAELYVVARVEFAPEGAAQAQVLATAGPERLSDDLQLPFSDVPVGSDRRVVAEVREGPGSAAQIAYYGISERFSLRAGDDKVVRVRLQLTAVPGRAQAGAVGLALDGANPTGARSDPEIVLLATTDRGAAIELSNLAGFPEGDSTRRSSLDDAELRDSADGLRSYAVRWNVERGRSEAEQCGAVDFCTRTVFGRFIDSEDYRSRVYELPVVIDRKPPQVLEDTVSSTLFPADDNLLRRQGLGSPKGVGRGTRLQVGFAMHELVKNVHVIGRGAGGVELPFTMLLGGAVSFLFELKFEAEREYIGSGLRVEVEAEDMAGNVSRSQLPDTTNFTLDTVAPAVLDATDERALTYIRRPYGPDPAGQPNPYFAIHGAALSVEPGATLLLFDDPDLTKAQRLGFVQAHEQDGSVDVELTRRDVDQVYAVAVDASGNASAPALVRRVDWTASFHGRTAGSAKGNPHRFDNRAWFLGTLDRAQSEVGGDALHDASTPLRAYGAGRWEGVAPSAAPDSRKFPRAAYDRARGQLVVFGGRKTSGPACDAGGSDLCSAVWEWDGRRWERRTIADAGDGLPAPREEHALAWDGRRGLTLIYGGRGPLGCEIEDSTFCADTWSYDGTRFKRLAAGGPDQPGRRAWHSLSYDPVRDRVVLFGGALDDIFAGAAASTALCEDTWEWDGAHWERSAESGGPSPRKGHASAFDPISGKTLVFGGIGENDQFLSDTWAWDGEQWQQLSAAPSSGPGPSARQDGAMTYSERLGRVVLYGGDAGNASCDGAAKCNVLWSFDGARWQAVPLADQALRAPGMTRATLGEDAFGNLVLLGGEDNDAVYTFRDGRYRERSGVLHRDTPPARNSHRLAHDPRSGDSVLFGGVPSSSGTSCPAPAQVCTDTWVWDGSGWAAVSGGPQPPACAGATLDFDANSAGAIWLGGRTSAPDFCTAAYRFDFATRSWAPGSELFALGDAARPQPRLGHASAQTPDGLVLLGGDKVDVELKDVWQLHGAAWTSLGDLPSARANAAAARFGDDQFVFFGGEHDGLCDGPGFMLDGRCIAGETFVGGTAGFRVAELGAGPQPPARTGHSLIRVEARAAPLLFGGQSGADCGAGLSECNDVWEWQTDHWRALNAADPERDGSPSVRTKHAMVYDSARAEGVLFAGRPGEKAGVPTSFADTWLWHPGHDAAPAQVARFDFGSTLAPPDTQLQSLELHWDADARAEGAEGAELWVFYQGRFQRALDAGFSAAESGSWRSDDAKLLDRLPFGADRFLGFAQTPRGVSGKLPDYAWVETRAISLRVIYLLPAAAAAP